MPTKSIVLLYVRQPQALPQAMWLWLSPADYVSELGSGDKVATHKLDAYELASPEEFWVTGTLLLERNYLNHLDSALGEFWM